MGKITTVFGIMPNLKWYNGNAIITKGGVMSVAIATNKKAGFFASIAVAMLMLSTLVAGFGVTRADAMIWLPYKSKFWTENYFECLSWERDTLNAYHSAGYLNARSSGCYTFYPGQMSPWFSWGVIVYAY